MADEEDLYAALGIEREAEPERIREAWRAIARAHHPDRNASDADEARFRRASAAWAVLKDPDRRLVYDRFGLAAALSHMAPALASEVRAVEAARARPAPKPAPQPPPRRPEPPPPPQEPRRPARPPPAPGTRAVDASRTRPTVRNGDVRADLVLTLEQAAVGGPRNVQVETPTTCTHCDGTGLRMSGRSCGHCRGSGVSRESRPVVVPIPVSVASGATVVVKGGGGLTSDGSRGDLYVTVTVREHAVFKRHGLDLHVELSLLPEQAAVGGEFDVPALEGVAKVRLTANQPEGKRIRIPGRGLPGPRGRLPGDLFATVVLRR